MKRSQFLAVLGALPVVGAVAAIPGKKESANDLLKRLPKMLKYSQERTNEYIAWQIRYYNLAYKLKADA